MKYSEVKHEDKFHEALSNAWHRVERYVLPVGIGVLVVLGLAAVWMAVARHRTSGADRPWAERFELGQRYADVDEEDSKEQTRKLLAELGSLIDKHRGEPVAAITLLEVAQSHLGLASAERDENPDAATDHLKRAAKAAEQFTADFADHPLLALAHYEAGKARLDLKQYERAAQHFEDAHERSDTPFLKALARLQAGLCYEQRGEVDKARQAYEAVRDNKGADGRRTWCADQAEYHLARLRRQPPRGS